VGKILSHFSFRLKGCVAMAKAEELLKRYDSLKLSEKEKQELLEYDLACEKGESTELDISEEQKKVVKAYTKTGTRKSSEQRKTAVRKPNETKGKIIAEMANFLENSKKLEISNLVIANKEKLITFSIGEKNYKLDLIESRKKKTNG
jgi:hypothetical protein